MFERQYVHKNAFVAFLLYIFLEKQHKSLFLALLLLEFAIVHTINTTSSTADVQKSINEIPG